MDFLMHSYNIVRRASGRYALNSHRQPWVWYYTEDGKVKTFATWSEARDFYREQAEACRAERAAKKAAKEATQKKVEEFKTRAEIKALIDAFCHNNGDGTCTIKRNFKMASGKDAWIEWNNGYTTRSWKCVALYVAGVGLLFTSGTIDRVIEYIATH